MPVNIGVNIQRSPNRINQNLREAGALGKFPKLLLDFKDEYYLANGGSKTFANAVTHARAGNATMTDGYGLELLTNGSYSDGTTGWTANEGFAVSNGVATVTTTSGSAAAYIQQSFSTVNGKTYILTYNLVSRVPAFKVSIDDDAFTNQGDVINANYNDLGQGSIVFTATSSTAYLRLIANTTTAGKSVSFDNVSVREMPVIKWAPHNLLRYSQQVNLSPWAASLGGVGSSPTRTADAGTAPDGTQTADRVQFDLNGGTTNADQSRLRQTVSGDNITFAVWLKSYDGSSTYNMQLAYTSGGGEEIVVTGDWQLFEMTQASSTTRVEIKLRGNQTPTHSDTADVLVWGAHLFRSDLGGMVDNPDQPPSRGSYVPTTSSAKYLPRVGHHVYNGNAWVNEGVLAESEARTNLLTYSQDFSNSYWTKSQLTATANEGVAPDGTDTAFKLVESSTSGIARHVSRGGGTLANSTQYTAAVYLKKGTRTKAKINLFTGGASHTGKYDIENGTVHSSAGADAATIEDVGNGWFRCSITTTTAASGNPNIAFGMLPDNYDVTYDGDGSSYIYAWGATLEASPTPSSYIPTSGSTVSRAAETFTIPSANLPWPTPQYIGSELVTNGTFDTDSDWSLQSGVSIGGGVLSTDGTSTGELARQSNIGITSGNLYAISLDVISLTAGKFGVKLGGTTPVYFDTTGSHEAYIVATATDNVQIMGLSGTTGSVDNISVREINPLSVSIAMEGTVSYADENSTSQAIFWQWRDDVNNRLLQVLRTNLGTGELQTNSIQDGTADEVRSDSSRYSPDVLVPFDIASRHGSTFVNGATQGVALTANTTPTALPDLSSTDLNLADDYMGTVSEFRVWDRDITDAGLVEATNPSLEPSLSLTFEGTGTNSFVVNDWSE